MDTTQDRRTNISQDWKMGINSTTYLQQYKLVSSSEKFPYYVMSFDKDGNVISYNSYEKEEEAAGDALYLNELGHRTSVFKELHSSKRI